MRKCLQGSFWLPLLLCRHLCLCEFVRSGRHVLSTHRGVHMGGSLLSNHISLLKTSKPASQAAILYPCLPTMHFAFWRLRSPTDICPCLMGTAQASWVLWPESLSPLLLCRVTLPGPEAVPGARQGRLMSWFFLMWWWGCNLRPCAYQASIRPGSYSPVPSSKSPTGLS